MKASMFLAGASAILASAGPINKRAMETKWVYEVVTETVTVDAPVQAQATEVVYQAVESSTTTTRETRKHKPKATSVPAVVYTTVVVPAAPETTSTSEVAQAAVTTVWVDSYDEPTTSSSSTKKTSTKTTEAAAVKTSAASDATLNLSLDEEYQTVMLNYHNIHRANHSVDALVWDATYASYAQTIANTCVFAHDMDQGTADYGQNIASWGSTGDISDLQNKCGAQSVTNQWYNSEMDNWSYYGQENPPASLDLDLYGHFTQVVWKDTTKLGCATALCAAGTMYDFEAWYTVCNYNPQGNYGGEYGENVLAPLGEKMVTV